MLKRRIVLINIIIFVGFIAALWLSERNYSSQQDINYYNKARVLLANDLKAIKKGDYEAVTHQFFVINLKGQIEWSGTHNVKEGDILDVSEQLQVDHAFVRNNRDMIKLVFAIGREAETEGFAVCIIEKSLVQSDTRLMRVVKVFAPIAVWGILTIIICVLAGRFAWIKLFNPIRLLTRSATEITEGNYEAADTAGALNGTAVGELSYKFDMMRDELKAKREREEQLKISQKELLSCMSHDLRTPITTIKAHAEAIRDGLAVTDEKRDKYIHTIIYKTDVVSKMISDLLDHSNAELNQLTINMKEVYIKDYLERITKELDIYCHHSNCHFSAESRVPEMLVIMDPDRITQVIFNLVENAVKYTDKPGKYVSFKTYIQAGRRLHVSVADNGPGISMTDIPYVFDRFYRAEKSRSTQIPGAGLGLSICRYIVEKHNGEISLDSRTGEGSEFSFYIDMNGSCSK